MRRLGLLTLLLVGCRTAADFRSIPPDETRVYAGDVHEFEARMLARHGTEQITMASRTMVEATTPGERASGVVSLWGTVHSLLGTESGAFLLTARQRDAASMSMELRMTHTVWGGLAVDAAWPWGYVDDCVGPPLAK